VVCVRLHHVTKPLWAPWRLDYIQRAGNQEGCIFCVETEGALAEDDSLVVHRGDHAFALLNRYPYTSGHLLVAPHRHVGELSDLTDTEAAELHRLVVTGVAALRAVYEPDAFNVGWNLGAVAGGSITGHVHEHVVPRWSGDTNFMPVLGDVRVLPEHLLETRAKLRAAWA
jgi:ATP adenylyltransferase